MRLFNEIQQVRRHPPLEKLQQDFEDIDESPTGFILINYEKRITKNVSRFQSDKDLKTFLHGNDDNPGGLRGSDNDISFRRKVRALQVLRSRFGARI